MIPQPTGKAFGGGVRVSMAFKALLCSGGASSPEQRSVLRAIHPFNPNKKQIRFLGGSSAINPTCRRRTQGLLWASRGLFLPAAAMAGLVLLPVVALGTAVPSLPPIASPPAEKKTIFFSFQSQPPQRSMDALFWSRERDNTWKKGGLKDVRRGREEWAWAKMLVPDQA
jgi:hypothetical protein